MEVENQVSFISPMLQNTQFGNVDDETTITFKEDVDTPMTIDASAPGDVIELSDDFDLMGIRWFVGSSSLILSSRLSPSTITKYMSILLA